MMPAHICRPAVLTTALVLLVASAASSQIVTIPAPFVGTDTEGFETQVLPAPFPPCVVDRVFNSKADLCGSAMSGAHITTGWSFMCVIQERSGSRFFGMASGGGYAIYTFDAPIIRFGGYFGTNGSPGDVTVRFYDSGGMLLGLETPSVPADCNWYWHGWETTGAGIKSIEVENSEHNGTHVMMDDMVISDAPPVPTCTLSGPVGSVTGDADLLLDAASVSSMFVDATFEYSLDAGVTFNPCTPSPSSPIPNPAVGIATGLASFTWDTVADMVGAATVATAVLCRASILDGVSLVPGQCETAPFDVDNTMLCNGICGDCNLNMMGPDVLDALAAAQVAAGLILPTPEQAACCDINVSGVVDVLDALGIAQAAAGLSITLVCL